MKRTCVADSVGKPCAWNQGILLAPHASNDTMCSHSNLSTTPSHTQKQIYFIANTMKSTHTTLTFFHPTVARSSVENEKAAPLALVQNFWQGLAHILARFQPEQNTFHAQVRGASQARVQRDFCGYTRKRNNAHARSVKRSGA